MMGRVRSITRMVCVAGVVLVVAASAAMAATQLGVRGGWTHASGELFEGADDPGSMGLYGFVASIGLFASIDLEFAYERYSKDFDVRDVSLGTVDVDYTDQAYLLTAKLNLPLAGGPFGVYGGAGGSLHQIDFEVRPDGGGTAVTGLDDERSEVEWHVVGGAGFRIPAVPLRAYAEARYQNVSGDSPTYWSAYAGLNVYLP